MSDKIDAVIASMGWDLDPQEWADMRLLCEADLAQQPATAVREEWRYIIERVVDELDALNCAFRDQIDDEMADPEEEFDRCAATDELIEQARAMLAIAPAAPVPQEPVQMHHEPHNRAMWHENCPGRRFSSPMKPRGDGSWECGVCGAVGRVTAPPSAEQPKCGTCNGHGMVGGLRQDGYDSETCPQCAGTGYDCPDCIAAAEQPNAAVMPCGTAVSNVYEAYEAGKKSAEQPDAMKVNRKTLERYVRHLQIAGYNNAADDLRALLAGGEQ
ncbi:hypothetical protein SAMN05216229_12363 [Geopseudomonas sagittaria]|uniref:Uncharacterized protein n=1 Tax=Geopseudomonas sagittaria TaxID=1135990 RepID=A0A1I5YRC4_9GAMM|nr:hypothetical protein [Pseudomonas sagittaria]SFQ46834.1 hypothetical protein SAMN05216229_12363 [Pseudomonas sagittaria]